MTGAIALATVAGAAPTLVVYTPNDTLYQSHVELPGVFGPAQQSLGPGARLICAPSGRGSTLVTLTTWPANGGSLPRRVRCGDGPAIRVEERTDVRLAEAFARATAHAPVPLGDVGAATAAQCRALGCARARDWLGSRIETLDATAVLVWIQASGCSPAPHPPTRPTLEAWMDRHPGDSAAPTLTAWSSMSDAIPWHRGVDSVFGERWCPSVPEALSDTLPPDGEARWRALGTLALMEAECGADPAAARREQHELARSGTAGDLALALTGTTDGIDDRVVEAAERHIHSAPLAVGDLRPLLLSNTRGPARERLVSIVRERVSQLAASDDADEIWEAVLLGRTLGEPRPDDLLRVLELDPTNDAAWWHVLDGSVAVP